jgi:hypothetical protein
MSGISLQPIAEKPKLNGPEGCLQHPPGPRHVTPEQEVPAMSFDGHYTDSTKPGKMLAAPDRGRT